MAARAGGFIDTGPVLNDSPDLRWEAVEVELMGPVGEDLPDLRWDTYEVEGSTILSEDLPDLRWDAYVLNVSGGGGTPTSWLMRALSNPGGTLVYWTVSNNPDFTGASAPEPVQVTTIVLVNQLR